MSFPLRPIPVWPTRTALPPQLHFLISEYANVYLSENPAPPQWTAARPELPFATFDQFVRHVRPSQDDASVLTAMFATLLRYGTSLVGWRLVLQRRTGADTYADKVIRYALHDLLSDPPDRWDRMSSPSKYQLHGAEMIRFALASSREVRRALPQVVPTKHCISIVVDGPLFHEVGHAELDAGPTIRAIGTDLFHVTFPEYALMPDECRLVATESSWFSLGDSDAVSPVLFAAMLSIVVRQERTSVSMPLHFRDTWTGYAFQRRKLTRMARIVFPAFDADTLDPFIVVHTDNTTAVDVIFVDARPPTETTMAALALTFEGNTVRKIPVPATTAPPAMTLIQHVEKGFNQQPHKWREEFEAAAKEQRPVTAIKRPATAALPTSTKRQRTATNAMQHQDQNIATRETRQRLRQANNNAT